MIYLSDHTVLHAQCSYRLIQWRKPSKCIQFDIYVRLTQTSVLRIPSNIGQHKVFCINNVVTEDLGENLIGKVIEKL